MQKCLSFLLVAATVAISVAFCAIMISMISWSLVFLTGALHDLSFNQIPALSFWWSFGIVFTIFLLAILLQVWRSNKKSSGR